MSLVPDSEIHIDEAESSGTYTKDVLFDKKTYQKILSKSLKWIRMKDSNEDS